MHRSFRFVAFSPFDLPGTLVLAVGLSAAISIFSANLLRVHEFVRLRFLQWSGIPISGFAHFSAFGGAYVRSPVSPTAIYAGRPWLLAVVCGAATAIFLAVYAYSKLSRSLMVMAMALLLISAAYSLWWPPDTPDSSFFGSFWLRCELAIWIFTPILVAMLAGIIVPSWWARILWITIAPAFSVIWSAARLAFCTGLLYYSGPVLALLLWAAFGLLAELLSLCLFYSLIAWQASLSNRRRMAPSAGPGAPWIQIG